MVNAGTKYASFSSEQMFAFIRQFPEDFREQLDEGLINYLSFPGPICSMMVVKQEAKDCNLRSWN